MYKFFAFLLAILLTIGFFTALIADSYRNSSKTITTQAENSLDGKISEITYIDFNEYKKNLGEQPTPVFMYFYDPTDLNCTNFINNLEDNFDSYYMEINFINISYRHQKDVVKAYSVDSPCSLIVLDKLNVIARLKPPFSYKDILSYLNY